MSITRRDLLKGSVLGAGVVAVGNVPALFSASSEVAAPELTYDAGALGGTTTLKLDRRGRRVDEYVSLAGTHTNCAGGPHPVGHVADLRGDRARRRAARSPRTTATCSRSTRSPRPTTSTRTPLTGAGSLRPRGRRGRPANGRRVPHRGRGQSERARVPLRAEHAARRYGSLRDGGALRAMRCSRLGRSCRTCPCSPSPARGWRSSGSRSPTRRRWSAARRGTPAIARQVEITRSRKFEGMWWGATGRSSSLVRPRPATAQSAEHDGQVWRYDPEPRRCGSRSASR